MATVDANASVSISAEDIEAIAAGVSGAGAFERTDVAAEPVPKARTWTLKNLPTGLGSEDRKTITVGIESTYAIDFVNDAAVNQRVVLVNSLTLSPDDGGITITNIERNCGTKVQFRMTGVTPGDYEMPCTVTYNDDIQATGTVLVQVVAAA